MQLFMKIIGSTNKILIILNKETKDMTIGKSIDESVFFLLKLLVKQLKMKHKTKGQISW